MFTSRSGLLLPENKPTLLNVYDADWATEAVGRLREENFLFPLENWKTIAWSSITYPRP